MTAQKFIEKKYFNRHFFLDAINENERDVIEFIADLIDEYNEQLSQSNVARQSEQLVICKKSGSSQMYQYTKIKDKCEDCGNIQDY